jgi:serine/threonine protein kinase
MPEMDEQGPDGLGDEATFRDLSCEPTIRPARGARQSDDLSAGPTVRGRKAGSGAGASRDLTEQERQVGRRAGDRVFGRYELQRVLGRGGMGIVWLATDLELHREVALKFLPDALAYNEGALADLKRETRRALELTHPHIVRVHDWLTDGEHAAVCMEYVDGKPLSALRAMKPGGVFEVDEIREWVGQLCEALEYAHARAGVVHRDLKPANLIVNAKGELKVTDFGIARSLGETMTRTTGGGGGVSGSPGYMSPQQWQGRKGQVSDDLYSLGATIYELLTGKPPFYTGDVKGQTLEETPPSMTRRREELEVEGGEAIPDTWEAMVAACLAKEPGQRPASAKEVAARLEQRQEPSVEPDNREASATGGGKTTPGRRKRNTPTDVQANKGTRPKGRRDKPAKALPEGADAPAPTSGPARTPAWASPPTPPADVLKDAAASGDAAWLPAAYARQSTRSASTENWREMSATALREALLRDFRNKELRRYYLDRRGDDLCRKDTERASSCRVLQGAVYPAGVIALIPIVMTPFTVKDSGGLVIMLVALLVLSGGGGLVGAMVTLPGAGSIKDDTLGPLPWWEYGKAPDQLEKKYLP